MALLRCTAARAERECAELGAAVGAALSDASANANGARALIAGALASAVDGAAVAVAELACDVVRVEGQERRETEAAVVEIAMVVEAKAKAAVAEAAAATEAEKQRRHQQRQQAQQAQAQQRPPLEALRSGAETVEPAQLGEHDGDDHARGGALQPPSPPPRSAGLSGAPSEGGRAPSARADARRALADGAVEALSLIHI